MCGIAGIYAFAAYARLVDPELLVRMRDTMVHRGPDGGHCWISDNRKVGLAFRRLAIIDLSENAMQPMSNEDQSIWVVFNGEIYNHAEIRRELETLRGHRWRSDHSDTEVIIHAYEQWGIDCLERFRGMFAIGIWDSRIAKLWLVRDRIGIKPLYYSVRNGQISFASEIKAILEDPSHPRDVDEEAFYHYLSFLTTPAPQTMFQGIRKVPGGCWVSIDSGGQIKENRYWDVWDHTSPITTSSDENIAQLILTELRNSVRLRKVSDVPVGVFLSGGIDSSTNAILFSEGESNPVKTFSVGYKGEYQSYQNEFIYARQIADLIKAEHYELSLTQDDLIDFLPRMVQLQDEPIADPVCVPVYYVSKLARENRVTVCQVGEGSDELFWGYRHWRNALRIQQAADLFPARFAGKAAIYLLKSAGKGSSIYSEYLRRFSMGQPIFWGGAEAFTEIGKKRLLSSRLRKQFAGYSSWEALIPIYQRFQEKAWEKSPLHWMTYLDLNLRLPELLLMRVDKMSMGVSLEGRVPFLDHKFVELALSIPQSVKTRNDNPKNILKKAIHGLVPENIIHRPKQGFGVPVHEWMFDRLGKQEMQELTEFCRKTDFLNPDEIRSIFNKKTGSQIWYLYNFALWWKEYIC